MSAHPSHPSEFVNVYTFEVEGIDHVVSVRAASEAEAREEADRRISRLGMTRATALISVQPRVAKRTVWRVQP